MQRLIVALVALAIIVLAGALAVGNAVDEGGERIDVQNETFNPTVGQPYFVEYANDTNVTLPRAIHVDVRISGSGITMVEGTDYEWDRINGTITPLAGGRLEGENNAEVDYLVRSPVSTQRDVAGIYADVAELGGVLVFVLGIIVVLAALGRFR